MTNCIFCKNDSTSSKSVEHIVPQSLGNTKNVLPRGVVCDKCNNYFSVKVEQPLMNLNFFRNLRARNYIFSKKGKLPYETVLLWDRVTEAHLHRDIKGNRYILQVNEDKINKEILRKSLLNEKVLFFSGIGEIPEKDRVVARFIGKVGLEVLAQRCVTFAQNMDIITYSHDFDLLRQFVRFNSNKLNWEYHVRPLYSESQEFFYKEESSIPVDMLYEYTLFFTEDLNPHVCLALKGYEFTMSLTTPLISSYFDWLKNYNYRSPLYVYGVNDSHPYMS